MSENNYLDGFAQVAILILLELTLQLICSEQFGIYKPSQSLFYWN